MEEDIREPGEHSRHKHTWIALKVNINAGNTGIHGKEHLQQTPSAPLAVIQSNFIDLLRETCSGSP